MTDSKDLPTRLGTQTVDHVVALAKGAFGAVPFVGGFLQELVGTTIPNQRMDRVIDFAERLANRLQQAELTIEGLREQREAFAETLEEAIRQAAAGSSGMRRAYLANLVAAGAQEAERNMMRTSHFMRLLDQLSDLEILMLAAQAGNDGAGAIVERAAGDANSASTLKLALGTRLVGSGMLEVEDERNSIFNSALDRPNDESSQWLRQILPKSTPRFIVTNAGREFLNFLDEESLPTE